MQNSSEVDIRISLCLICSESIVVLKDCNIARHYNLRHKEKYKNCVSALRRKKGTPLDKCLESQQCV